MSYEKSFTKENLDYYLKELAKEFRKQNGRKTPAEIVLVGGASILINYGFREMTYDMDACIHASSVMKEAINNVGDRFGLPNGWLNDDFTSTKSYTPKLIQYSKPYRIYSNILSIRTVTREHLIAMKLVSGRIFKNDLSDIIGILHYHHITGHPITYEQIDRAVTDLYGNWSEISTEATAFLETVLKASDLEKLYRQYRDEETDNHDILITFNNQNPQLINENSIENVLKVAKQKKKDSNSES